MDMIKEEELFLEILEGKEKIHEVELSNGMTVKLRTPTNKEVAEYELFGLKALERDDPETYEKVNVANMNRTVLIDPTYDFYREWGWTQAICNLITPTFEGWSIDVDDDMVYDFVMQINPKDKQTLFMKYLEISGQLITEEKNEIKEFRKDPEGAGVDASPKSRKGTRKTVTPSD